MPSTVEWRTTGARLSLATRYPLQGDVRIALDALDVPREFALALRIPAWCAGARLAVNGRAIPIRPVSGYALVRRRWSAGDVVELRLPLAPRVERADGDDRTIAPASSETYVARAAAAGDSAKYELVEGVDHRSIIRPDGPAWNLAVSHIARLLGEM